MSTTTPTRDRLHVLINALDETDLSTADQVRTALVNDDPVGLALALAPIDEERVAVAEAKAALARGEVISHADIEREFGLA